MRLYFFPKKELFTLHPTDLSVVYRKIKCLSKDAVMVHPVFKKFEKWYFMEDEYRTQYLHGDTQVFKVTAHIEIRG